MLLFTDVVPLACTDHVFVCNIMPSSFNAVPVQNINAVPVQNIIGKVVYMPSIDDANCVYIAKFPNTVECD